MKHKKALFGLERTAGLLVLLVFLALFILVVFRPEQGWLPAVAKQAEIFRTFIPGEDSLKEKTELTLSQELETAYDSLYTAFTEGQKSPNTKCIIYYKEVPELNKWSLGFVKGDNEMLIKITNPDGQTKTPKTIPNLVPCIVAGKQGQRIPAQNFYLQE